MFDRKKWTVSQAKRWLSDHGYKTPQVDTTAEYHRFRQRPPFDFQRATFRTIAFGKRGIKAVVAVPRSAKPNPSKRATTRTPKQKRARVPKLLVDIADAISIDLEGGDTIKFPVAEKWALCAARSGTELWILSRQGAKTVAISDKKAESLYEKFTGWEHDEQGLMVNRNPPSLKHLGRCMNIVYRSDKFSASGDKHRYVHAFNIYPTVSADRPNKPTILALRGGRIHIKQEGITG